MILIFVVGGGKINALAGDDLKMSAHLINMITDFVKSDGYDNYIYFVLKSKLNFIVTAYPFFTEHLCNLVALIGLTCKSYLLTSSQL